MEKIPLFLKLQSKAIAMYSGVTKNVMDNEAIITQSSTTINPFRREQGPVTPSRRPPPRAPPKTRRARRKNYLLNLHKPTSLFELFRDVKFLRHFFSVFSPIDRCILAQVCLKWKDVLYSDPGFWKGLLPVIYYNDLRRIPDKPNLDHLNTNCISYHLRTKLRTQESNESNDSTISDSSFDDAYSGHPTTVRASLYASIEKRGFDCICLYSATDADIFDFASRVSPSTLRIITFGSIRCSTITDKGLDIFLASLSQSLRKLEIIGCNEISDSGLWTSLVPHLDSLTIRDCINVGDETIAATSQMLPELRELCLQTYHMSDASTTFFSAVTMRGKLRVIRLENCWEMTNQGVLNICSSLPYLEKLSLLGCSKITDDCVELISENLKNLKVLDISWCNRITDVGVESIACDFAPTLEELIIDRCQGVSDHSLGFVAAMPHLKIFTFRWCPNISDYGLQVLCTSTAIKVLSLAGCPLLTATGLRHLKQMKQLEEVELTNISAATSEVIDELKESIPDCEFIT